MTEHILQQRKKMAKKNLESTQNCKETCETSLLTLQEKKIDRNEE